MFLTRKQLEEKICERVNREMERRDMYDRMDRFETRIYKDMQNFDERLRRLENSNCMRPEEVCKAVKFFE